MLKLKSNIEYQTINSDKSNDSEPPNYDLSF